jgi:hypothetical protein
VPRASIQVSTLDSNCGALAPRSSLSRALPLHLRLHEYPPRCARVLCRCILWSRLGLKKSSSIEGCFSESPEPFLLDSRYKELDGTIKLVRRESKHEAHGGQRGSLHRQQDLPMERLSELFNVNHFVVSQVSICLTCVYTRSRGSLMHKLSRWFRNCDTQVHPHMVPFLRTQKSRSRRTLLHKAFVLLCQETWHWISMFAENVWEPSFFTWIREEVAYMSVGDVVIVPRLSLKNIALLFQNPNQEV